MRTKIRSIICFLVFLFAFTAALPVFAKERGIYITQDTLERTDRIKELIHRSKAVGINTFVVDFERPSKLTTQNLALIKDSGLKYVARIVIFPDGAKTRDLMFSERYREKKFALIKQAVDLGANAIQIDYIRYSSKNKPSDQNAQDVNSTVKWYYNKLRAYNNKIPLQMDVFGITSFHPEKRIGQYPKVFVNNIDSINPMVYPSHYEPYKLYSAQPYKTIYDSLQSLKAQLKDEKPVRIVAFIEASNYRYPLPGAKKSHYVSEEIRAVEDSNVDGWYFWSANNIYDHVFNVLKNRQSQKAMNENDKSNLKSQSS